MKKKLIIIRFRNTMMTARQYIAFSKELLSKLESFYPIFKNLFGWGHESISKRGFNDDKSNFEEIVFSQLVEPGLAYINKDNNNKIMQLDSYSRAHYSNSYSNIEEGDGEKVTVNITCGNTEKEIGSFFIELPATELGEFADLKFIDRLFKFCLDLFEKPLYGVVITEDFRRKVRKSEFSYWIGLINYFSDSAIFKLLPSSVSRMYFLNGTLFYLSPMNAFCENEEVLNRAIQIRNLLGKKGYLV